jgi:hypothetical protein
MILDLVLYILWCDDINLVLCHHDTAHPQAADDGDGLQMWAIAEKIGLSNK